jgi:IS30 family transposase
MKIVGWNQAVIATLSKNGGAAMATTKRSKLSESEQEQLWRGYRDGQSCRGIGLALGRHSEMIRAIVRRHGGFSPRARRRNDRQLSLPEREEITRGLSAQLSIRQIAVRLCRAASSVSREVRRNGGRSQYRALRADQRAWQQARRPKRCKLALQPRLRAAVAEGLCQRWSAKQIAERLPKQFPHDHSRRVSHETIYRSLFIQARGVLKKQLLAHLRSGRTMRRARHASPKGKGQGQIVGAVSIRERPAEVEDRAVPGHWEGDLISGSKNSHILTLVERHTRYLMLAKVPSRHSAEVVKVLSKKIGRLPAELRRSLTWDRGAEMANHKDFTIATDVQVYFCDPHSPWQRGSNENTNGLLRQYFPKGTDLSVHSQAHLDNVAIQMNGRPRQTLDFDTPAERFNASVALTV